MGTLVAPDDLKAHLITTGTSIERPRGTYLFRRGEPVTGIFLIVEGVVRLGLDGNPASFPWREVGRGSVVGLPATLSDASYSLTAEVLEHCRLIFLPRQSLLDLLRQKPELCFQVMSILTEELTQTRTALERVRRASA
jgi:CRP-like cAMP-binding protein